MLHDIFGFLGLAAGLTFGIAMLKPGMNTNAVAQTTFSGVNGLLANIGQGGVGSPNYSPGVSH